MGGSLAFGVPLPRIPGLLSPTPYGLRDAGGVSGRPSGARFTKKPSRLPRTIAAMGTEVGTHDRCQAGIAEDVRRRFEGLVA